MNAHYDLFIFAGELSGDLHGAKLLEALYEKNPHLKILGVGGPLMRAVGMECILPMEKFEVMGLVDVFLALPRLIRQFYQVRNAILKTNPKVVVTIDYPGFNLRLALKLRKKKFKGKLCHYICPSVWAWKKKRVELMTDNLDLLLTILPFEKQYFAHTTLDVQYVGHPLTQQIFPLLPPPKDRFIAIFPGSREKEIKRNLPLYFQVATTLLKEFPDLKFGMSVAHPKFLPLIEKIKQDFKIGKDIELFSSENKEDLMKKTFLAMAKSGTVTLELALHEIPTIVTYAISPLDVFLAKYIFRIRLPFYCLANIIASQEIFPELIGPTLTEARLHLLIKKFITDSERRESCIQRCKEVRHLLGNFFASKRAAELILSLVET